MTAQGKISWLLLNVVLLAILSGTCNAGEKEVPYSFKKVTEYKIAGNRNDPDGFFIEGNFVYYENYLLGGKLWSNTAARDYRNYELCKLNMKNAQITKMKFPPVELYLFLNIIYGKRFIYLAGRKYIYKIDKAKFKIIKKAKLPRPLYGFRCYITYDKAAGREYLHYFQEISIDDAKSELGYSVIRNLVILDADTLKKAAILPGYRLVYGSSVINDGNVFVSREEDGILYLEEYNFESKKFRELIKIGIEKDTFRHNNFSLYNDFILISAPHRFFIYDVHNFSLSSSGRIDFDVYYSLIHGSLLFIVGQEGLSVFDIKCKKIIYEMKFDRNTLKNIVHNDKLKLNLILLETPDPAVTRMLVMDETGKILSEPMIKGLSLIRADGDIFYFLSRAGKTPDTKIILKKLVEKSHRS